MAYTPEEIETAKDHIIDRMILKRESLNSILLNDYDMCLPSPDVVYRWLREGHSLYDKTFSDNYALAREIRAELIFDDVLSIADDGMNDTYVDPETGRTFVAYDVVQRSKLRVDARKWYLARMAPKKFGDKVEKTVIKATPEEDPVDYEALKDSTLEDVVANAKKDDKA